MSKEDRDWLSAALKSYTFNDTDRLTEICKELQEKKEIDKAKMIDMLEELQELVELHPRNNLNLCLTGGMQEILAIILGYPDIETRKLACSIFTSASQNHKEVQEFSTKLGACNISK